MRYGLPPGVTFACLAETILLSFVQATEPDRVAGLLSVARRWPRGRCTSWRAGRPARRAAGRPAVDAPGPTAPVVPAVPAPRVELHAFGTRTVQPAG